MSIEEYIARLTAALSGCDPEEAQSAVSYYTEILEDAEDPEELMKSFGTPEQLADAIRRENGRDNEGAPQYAPSPNKGGDITGRVIALIFTSPFWLTVYILIAALAIVVWAVYICFPFCAAATVLAGARMTVLYIPYAVELFSAAFVCAGASVLLFRPVIAATKGIWTLFTAFSRFLFTFKNNGAGKEKKPPKEKKPLFKPALFAGSGLLAAGLVLTGITVTLRPSNDKFAEKLGLEDYSIEITSNIKDLNITVDNSGGLKILPTDGDKARLEIENGKTDNLKLTDSADCEISYSSRDTYKWYYGTQLMNIHYPRTKLTLYLPSGDYENIKIDVTCGDLDFKDFSAEVMDLRSSLGDIDVSGCTVESFRADADFGEINVTDSKFSGDSSIIADCGDITLANLICGGMSITEDLGDVKISSSSFSWIQLENDCGDLDFEGAVLGGDSDINMSLGDARLTLRGDNYNVKADTELGDVSINGVSPSMSDLSGDTVVRIHNECGDITVNTVA